MINHNLQGKVSQRWMVFTVLLVVSLLIQACSAAVNTAVDSNDGDPSTGTTDTSPTAEPSAQAATPLPETGDGTSTEATATDTIERDDLVYGSGNFDLLDPAVGFADLPAYQLTVVESFEGTLNGEPIKLINTYAFLSSINPYAFQITYEVNHDGTITDSGWLAEQNGTRFERYGQTSCTASVSQEGAPLADQYNPASFLDSLVGAAEVGDEEVNGVNTTHYSFDQAALGEDGIIQANGNVWIASQGGYVVKYLVTRTGTGEFFGAGAEGTETIDYSLTALDQTPVLEIPEDCPAGMVNAPILENPENLEQFPGSIRYESAASLTDAVAFYITELPKLGWSPVGDPLTSETSTLLIFHLGSEDMNIMINNRDGGGSKVDIMVIRSE